MGEVACGKRRPPAASLLWKYSAQPLPSKELGMVAPKPNPRQADRQDGSAIGAS